MSDTDLRMEKILEKFPAGDSGILVHALQDVQAEFNYLPADAVKMVAGHLEVPASKAYSVATFYKAFSLKPRGDTILKCCMGTTCHIKGAPVVVEDIREGLGIGPGETTSDMKYTLEVVNCVGACALAPVVIANDKYIANIKPGTIIKKLRKG